jgi:hypothetical protein
MSEDWKIEDDLREGFWGRLWGEMFIPRVPFWCTLICDEVKHDG